MRSLILAIAVFLSIPQPAWPSAGAKSEFPWEKEISEAITKSGLDRIIPKELSACEGYDTKAMWIEFMKGLSYMESSWDPKKNNKCDLGCDHPSKGLFQMTGGNTALGRNCFGTTDKMSDAPYDPKANITCAVDKMVELLSGAGGASESSRKISMNGEAQVLGTLTEHASKYWGPFKEDSPARPKAENLIADVAGHCGANKFAPYILEQGSETRSHRAGQNSRAKQTAKRTGKN